MVEGAEFRVFDGPLSCLASPHLGRLAARLSAVDGLGPGEAEALHRAAEDAVYSTLNRKLSRLLVLELNAARIEGRLEGESPEARWRDFLEGAATPAFWEAAEAEYPTLAARVERMTANQCDAALALAAHFAVDRESLSPLCGGPPGELRQISFASGDRHRGGKTVAILHCDGGRLVHKPRSLATDHALSRFLENFAELADRPLFIAVPAVVDRGDRGWAQFIAHRFAADEEELRSFYRGIGQWIALMRALGGTDFHAENLIASGGIPVLVDCETLFTPNVPPFPSRLGEAFDRSAALVSGSVLAIGLLPERGQGLGWRGIDMSGVGGLPDQQRSVSIPTVVDTGTDRARIGMVAAQLATAQNHPSTEPALARFWPQVLEGFSEVSARLHDLDRAGKLRPLLDAFDGCRVRVVVRATEVYAELERMLWHPVSLRDEASARRRAEDLLGEMAKNVSFAPSDRQVITAEVEDLLEGDIPYFSTPARDGRLEGPRGTQWLPRGNLVDAALDDWRASDQEAERRFIQAALVSAYVNDGWLPEQHRLTPAGPSAEEPEASRRRHAAGIVCALIDHAITGNDGSVSWIAPTLAPTGWSVAPLGPDLYGGLSGLALLVGAYVRERDHGRADDVAGIDDLLARLLRSLSLWEAKQEEQRTRGALVRPPPTGGFVGLGSQIWTRLTLARLGVDADGIESALRIARSIEWAAAGEDSDDLLYGRAGAIVPLLALSAATGDRLSLDLAKALGDGLCEAASWDGGRAFWTHAKAPEGLGGFAHGVSGFGWALHKLAKATGGDRYHAVAEGAWAFEDALFDPQEKNWIDLRNLQGPRSAAAWCHGAVGIALSRLDLDRDLSRDGTRQTLERALGATWRTAIGWNHCLCHGDFGAFELLDAALRHDLGPSGLTRDHLRSELLSSLDEHGPTCGVVRDAFTPGLFTGNGGVAYQLLRMHPESSLPSVLLLEEASVGDPRG